jgi:hypothetical protein
MASASTISVKESAAAGRWASTLVRPNHAHANLQLIGFTNAATFAFLQNYALFRTIFTLILILNLQKECQPFQFPAQHRVLSLKMMRDN